MRKSRKIMTGTVVGIAMLYLIGAYGQKGGDSPTVESQAQDAAVVSSAAPSSSSSSSSPTPAPAPAPSSEPVAPQAAAVLYQVTDVIDGDTIDTAMPDGSIARIRILGIDAPEMDTCEGQPAKDAMVALVGGQQVSLTAASDKDDTDKYGRLLRYVDRTDGIDSGLSLIQQGHAIARYDSRDGYGTHPREQSYIVTDEASPDYVCPAPAPAPEPEPAPAPQVDAHAGGDADDDHGPVIIAEPAPEPEPAPAPAPAPEPGPASAPAPAPDNGGGSVYYKNCDAARAAGAAPLHVGDPGYRGALDRDHDGVACES